MLARIYLYSWLRKFKSIEKESEDIFFIESIFLSYLSLMLERMFPNVPVVTRIHGALPEVAFWTKEKYRNDLMGFVLKTKRIAVTTYHYVDYLISKFEVQHTNNLKFYILPNTLPKVSEDNISHSGTKMKLLQLGRMDEQGYFQKGFQDVLQALYYLEETQSKDVLEKIEYTYIGNGALTDKFNQQLKKLVYIRVRHYPSLPNVKVQREIDTSSVVLLPSRYEGMSMFATEVLSKGKPFIYTADGGMRDAIIDGFNGLAVRPFDYIGLAEAILSYSRDINVVQKFSMNSKVHFNKEFSYDKVNSKFGVMLRDL